MEWNDNGMTRAEGVANGNQEFFLVPKFQGISFFAEEHEYIHGIYLVYTA